MCNMRASVNKVSIHLGRWMSRIATSFSNRASYSIHRIKRWTVRLPEVRTLHPWDQRTDHETAKPRSYSYYAKIGSWGGGAIVGVFSPRK